LSSSWLGLLQPRLVTDLFERLDNIVEPIGLINTVGLVYLALVLVLVLVVVLALVMILAALVLILVIAPAFQLFGLLDQLPLLDGIGQVLATLVYLALEEVEAVPERLDEELHEALL